MDINYDSAVIDKSLVTAEALLNREINQRQLYGYQFCRQTNQLSSTTQFICQELKLVVELYDEQSESMDKLKARTQLLEYKGFQVARLSHIEITRNLSGVMAALSVAIRQCKKSLSMRKMASRYLSGGLCQSKIVTNSVI